MVFTRNGQIYTGSVIIKELGRDLSKQNPNEGPKYSTILSHIGYLSMIHIMSRNKPIKVTLELNGQVFGVCEGDNIKLVYNIDEFEDFKGEIKPDRDFYIRHYEDHNSSLYYKYKIVMFGNDKNFNCREGIETESYFLPLHEIKYMEPSIVVHYDLEGSGEIVETNRACASQQSCSMGNMGIACASQQHERLCIESQSCSIGSTNTLKLPPVLVSEYIYPNNIYDMLSLRGDYKTIYRVSNGCMGAVAVGKEENERMVKLYKYDV